VPTASRRRGDRGFHFLRRAAEEADEIGAALLAIGDVDVHDQDPARQREPDVGGRVCRPRGFDDGRVARGACKAALEEAFNFNRYFLRGARKDAVAINGGVAEGRLRAALS
jgi:hypothetical protein